MKTTQTLMTLGLAALLITLAGCKKDDNDDEDTSTDTTADTTPDTTADTSDDTAADTPTDTVADTAGDADATDTIDDDAAGCPPDDATHVYISVSGTVNVLGTGSADGVYVAAISPMDALINPTPTPLAETTAASDGAFSLECFNVSGVLLGLVILVDDDPDDGIAGTFFPTGTGVQAWTSATDAEDMTTAQAFAIPNTVRTGIETLTGVDATTDGFAMGLVVDGTTGAPINEATVTLASGGAADVAYLNATLDGLETDSNTSANGSYVFTEPLTLSAFTAVATGYDFGDHQAATKAGFCYFLVMPGTPAG